MDDSVKDDTVILHLMLIGFEFKKGHACYAILTAVALVAAVALPYRAASSIWRHRRYHTVTPGLPGWPPHARAPFNSLFVLANIPDCI